MSWNDCCFFLGNSTSDTGWKALDMLGGVVVGSDLSGIRYGGPKMELDNSINGISDALVAIFKNSLSLFGECVFCRDCAGAVISLLWLLIPG